MLSIMLGGGFGSLIDARSSCGVASVFVPQSSVLDGNFVDYQI